MRRRFNYGITLAERFLANLHNFFHPTKELEVRYRSYFVRGFLKVSSRRSTRRSAHRSISTSDVDPRPIVLAFAFDDRQPGRLADPQSLVRIGL